MSLITGGVPGTTKRIAPGKGRLKEVQNSMVSTATPQIVEVWEPCSEHCIWSKPRSFYWKIQVKHVSQQTAKTNCKSLSWGYWNKQQAVCFAPLSPWHQNFWEIKALIFYAAETPRQDWINFWVCEQCLCTPPPKKRFSGLRFYNKCGRERELESQCQHVLSFSLAYWRRLVSLGHLCVYFQTCTGELGAGAGAPQRNSNQQRGWLSRKKKE